MDLIVLDFLAICSRGIIVTKVRVLVTGHYYKYNGVSEPKYHINIIISRLLR